MASRRTALSILLSVTALSGCGSGRSETAAPYASAEHAQSTASTRAMAARLRDLAEQADPSRNAFLNERRVELARQQMVAAQGNARIGARIYYGIELLMSGRSEQAHEELVAARDDVLQARMPLDAESIRTFQEVIAASCFRIGEQENCLVNHTSDSCLMPIQGGGVHTVPRGSRLALQECLWLLQLEPDNAGYRWLVNLAHQTLGSYPAEVPSSLLIPPAVFLDDYALPRYPDVAMQVGVATVGLSGGTIMEDLDRDGDLDLMCSSWGLTDQLRFLVNNGDGTFTDRTDAAGLTGIVGGLNLVHADYDNDGFADVLVLRGAWLGSEGRHPNSLLRNQGDGTFRDVTEEAGLLCFHPTQTGAWTDVNHDGWLDLFIGNESRGAERHPCQLFLNMGDGTFRDFCIASGLQIERFVKAAAWGDIDNDGWPDLYLSCYGEPNMLWRNEGPIASSGGSGAVICRFRNVTTAAGVAEPAHSFPAWFWDYDNDGWQDIFVASFGSFEGSTLAGVVADYLDQPTDADRARLYRNNGDGTFSDVTSATGLSHTMLAMGANYGDVDNDGWLDCYLGTGEPSLLSLVPNRMYRNDRGQRFQLASFAGGFGHIQKGHGIAFGDLDRDGDQDIYAVMGGAYSGDVYQNALFLNPGNDNRWITLRLEGVTSNRSAIGARIRVDVSTPAGLRSVYVTAGTGGSFGSSSLQQEIGLGDATAIERLEITWPATGLTQTFRDVPLDRVLAIREDAAAPTVIMVEPIPMPLVGPEAGGRAHEHAH